MSKHSQGHHDHDDLHGHEHTITSELVHHFPYAVFSVAFALAILGILTFVSSAITDPNAVRKGFKVLFHSFHFMHILFAATGTVLMFRRFSKSIPYALIIGVVSPLIFCAVSDSVLPYWGGRALGIDMHFHLCIFHEYKNIIPFLIAGIINGFILSSQHEERQGFYSVFSHFIHIFISSLASIFYLVSHGYINWYQQIGGVFIFAILAVVVPCTMSDIVVPVFFAKAQKGNEKH